MKASLQFKEAVRTELKRQTRGRAREAADSQPRVAKDIQAGRQGLNAASRKLGYARTELEQWARESNDQTVRAMAGKMAKLVDTLRSAESDLEKIHVQVNRLK